MLKTKDLSETFNLPEEFLAVLPMECATCGLPTVISETLTSLQCSNPRCSDKLVMRMKAMLQALGIKGFGEAALETIASLGVVNPLELMSLRPGEYLEGISEAVSDKVHAQIKKESEKGMLLWEYVALAQLPGIQTSAEPLFKGYKNLDDFYNDLESGGPDFVQNLLGIAGNSDTGYSIKSITIFDTLMLFKEDLKEGIDEGWVKVRELSSDIKELKVVCSDQVGGDFKTKKDFYRYVEDNFPEYHVTFGTSVNKSIDCLVWAGADGSPARFTSKVKKVLGYNSRGTDIPILTATEFIDKLSSQGF